MGNCEESLGFERDDCGCGFTEDSACDVLSRQWFDYANRRITNDDKTWMRSLPRRISFEMSERTLTVVHGSFSDISGWVFGTTRDHVKTAELGLAQCDGIIAGHCGLPFHQTTPNNQLWLNAGVIGMPANDGTPRGWYSILEPGDNETIRVCLESFDYDHIAAANAIHDAGLADGYAKALITGLWPNMDVLPNAEAQTQGQPLSTKSHLWLKDAESQQHLMA